MPNINLLDGKDFSREVEKIDEESVSFQDFQVEESEQEIVAPPVEQEVVKEPVKQEEETVVVEEREPFRRRSSNMPMIVGVAASFIIILLIIYFLMGRDGEQVADQPEQGTSDSTEVVTEAGQQDSTQVVQQPAEEAGEQQQQPNETEIPAPPPPVRTEIAATPSLSEARKTGVAGASLLGEFLSAFPSGMKMSFFRYGNGSYSAEVAVTSDNVFNQFEQNLKSQNTALSPQVLSEKEIMVSGQVMKMRQINGTFPTTGSSPAATQELASNKIRSEITAAAGRFNLELKQLSVSPTVSSDAGQFKPATLKAFGDQSNMIGFIQDMLKYRNVGINRLMLSVLSQTDLMGTNMMATLDLDIYQ
jgi:hypothetical protein